VQLGARVDLFYRKSVFILGDVKRVELAPA